MRADGLVSVIADPDGSARRDGAGFSIGVFEPDQQWSLPRAPAPEGCFALFRADDEHVELVADAAATRTIWYAKTEDLFVASTSQRAIVAMLGSFRPNPEACAWLLSSGTLGPGRGWDSRVERVAPGARVLLRRSSWRLEVRETRIAVTPPADAPDPSEQRRRLQALVDDVVGKLELDFSRWRVPLSGGVDSRGLLLALRHAPRSAHAVKCITWGRRAAREEPGNDARIARELAERLGVEHEYLVVEATSEPRERFLERFLVAGEGRVDSIGGYVDGFDVWKRLREAGVEGVIRGDEAFGWKRSRTELDVRESVQLTLLEDIFGVRAARDLGLSAQRIPEALEKRPDESLPAWRDRLYQQFRLPVMLAALTDLKTPYVEVLNPFLYARVLAQARKLPDELRTDKRLWRSMVDAASPDLPYATRSAVPSPRAFVQDAEMIELILDELASARAVDLFGATAVRLVRADLEAWLKGRTGVSTLAASRSRIGRFVRNAKKRLIGRLHADPFALAFRMLIASRMGSMLHDDAASSPLR